MQPKQIPYGISNFEKIRRENYAYVDKTRFIEMIENDPTEYAFLIRPRKFGKSLFVSTLIHYYDVCYKDDFDVLFGDLQIGKNPTLKHNNLLTIKFDFSGLNTNTNKFEYSFFASIRADVIDFITAHKTMLNNYEQIKSNLYNKTKDVKECLKIAFDIANSLDRKMFVIIDEYDHFANDLIAEGTNLNVKQYQKLIWTNSVVRDFYETLKSATDKTIDKIFITGVTPVMLDDITSGFNISDNISLSFRFNEILGFTEEDTDWLTDVCGVNKNYLKDIDRKFLYNGYLFNDDGENTLYNPAMVLYILYQTNITKGRVKSLIDSNLKTDYGRIRTLVTQHANRELLKQLINDGEILQNVVDKFSILTLHDNANFLSLLYYMGLLTISKNETGRQVLKIPNYSTKINYWEYVENIINDDYLQNVKLPYNSALYQEYVSQWADYNDPKPFMDFIQGNFVDILSNRDLQNFDEKDIKMLIMLLIYQSNFYLPISEFENSKGYADIYLQRRPIYHDVPCEWVIELKYIKTADGKNEKIIESKKTEAIEQLKKYKTSIQFRDKTDIRYLAVVFIGKKDYRIEELK
jgi:hypothetical protein